MHANPVGGAVLVQGASGGIGLALTRRLLERDQVRRLFAATRNTDDPGLTAIAAADSRVRILALDVEDDDSVARAADSLASEIDALDVLISCAGLLHDSAAGMAPERRLSAVRPAHLERAFRVNAIGSLLLAQAFESLMRRAPAPLFTSISARVGSIADNRLGGWYAYRASKAALNMYLKTLAIEWGRGSRPIRVLALHPGTVATALSSPFTDSRPNSRQVFDADDAAARLLSVIDGLDPTASGLFLDWQGEPIPW